MSTDNGGKRHNVATLLTDVKRLPDSHGDDTGDSGDGSETGGTGGVSVPVGAPSSLMSWRGNPLMGRTVTPEG